MQRETPVRKRPAPEREALAERIADRLDLPMAALGIVFLLLVLAEVVVAPGGDLARWLAVAGWVIWALFVAEFLLRLAIAPSAVRFLRRNWWQIAFLVLPFLRVVRVLARLRFVRTGRLGRGGRILASAVRSSRTTGGQLRSRLGWVVATTTIVVLATSQLLYEFADLRPYGDALYRTALATIAGETIESEHALARVVGVLLAAYSVAVFATVAASVGAYWVERTALRADPYDSGGLVAGQDAPQHGADRGVQAGVVAEPRVEDH